MRINILTKKTLVTGKSSRFCKYLKNHLNSKSTIFVSKKEFNILNFKSMENFIRNKKIKLKYLIHVAGLSRPMSIHEKNICESIDLNIIGTANIVKICKKFNIKLIFISSSYVYPGSSGNYSENSPLKPFNNYSWSKLGGESSVHMYKNSLILRICMTDYPFIHKKAIKGAFTSFTFNKNVAELIPHILNQKGILNVGGKKREIYKFAKKFSNNKITSINYKKILNFPKDSSLNLNKLKDIIKRKKLKKLNVII